MHRFETGRERILADKEKGRGLETCAGAERNRRVQRARSESHLQHVHHLLQLGGLDPRRLLHGEALKVLNDAEPVDLSLVVLQQLLQDHAVGAQDLTAHIHSLLERAPRCIVGNSHKSPAHLVEGDLFIVPVLDVEEQDDAAVLVSAGQDPGVPGLDGAAHGLRGQVLKQLGVVFPEAHVAWG